MLKFPGLFLLLAAIAGAMGYGGLAGRLSEFFKTLFFALMALAVLGCILNRVRDTLEPGDEEVDGGREQEAPD